MIEITITILTAMLCISGFFNFRRFLDDSVEQQRIEYTPTESGDESDLEKAAAHLQDKYVNDTNVVGIGIAKITGASYISIYTAKSTKKYPKRIGNYPVIVTRIGRIKPL